MERDLAQLTLSDPEQRELYEAARLVQTAFRKYKVQEQRSAVLQSAVTGTGVFGFGLKRLQSLTSVWSHGVLKSEVHLELVVWKCAGDGFCPIMLNTVNIFISTSVLLLFFLLTS